MNEVEDAAAADTVLAEQIGRVLDRDIRPYLQSHGGDVELAGVSEGMVRVRMFAACGACELKPVTFAARIRVTLLEVPGVTDVTCGAVAFSSERLDQIASFFA